MRRILLVLSVAAVMAALVVASAMPAFAKLNCNYSEDYTSGTCSGGGSISQPGGVNTGYVGGSGGHSTYVCDTNGCDGQAGGGGGYHVKF